MRELILTMSVSLDGFVGGREGEIDWMFGGDQEAEAWKLKTVSNVGLHIMGRPHRAADAFTQHLRPLYQ